MRRNYYSGVGLDRADHRRQDSAWLEGLSLDIRSRFVAVWRNHSLVREDHGTGIVARAVWLGSREAISLRSDVRQSVFLGLEGGRAYFAVDVSHLEENAAQKAVEHHGRFLDLRAVGPVIEPREGAILAYARGLLYWHRRHLFCGVCGSPTVSRHGGHQRQCSNAKCATLQFPRTDPAVIMLVHDGERCVLGRQKIWPPGMHSTLAGFVEPGESLEEAVAREVKEEVGIEVFDVVYHSSQPWPFPSSIMLGFHARAHGQPLSVNVEELDGAAWFTRDQLMAAPNDDTLRLPRRDSIARRLVDDWINGEDV